MGSSTISRVTRGVERAALHVVAVVTALVAVASIASIVAVTVSRLTEQYTAVREMLIGNSTTPAFTKAPAIREASYDSVTATIEDLPDPVRWLLVAEQVTPPLATLGVSLCLLWLCIRLLKGRPFGRSVSAAVGVSAVVILIGGTLSQVLAAIARAEVVAFLGVRDVTAGGTTGDPSYEGFIAFGLSLDLGVIGVGLALAVVAAAFEYGEKLQRDTDGLV